LSQGSSQFLLEVQAVSRRCVLFAHVVLVLVLDPFDDDDDEDEDELEKRVAWRFISLR